MEKSQLPANMVESEGKYQEKNNEFTISFTND